MIPITTGRNLFLALALAISAAAGTIPPPPTYSGGIVPGGAITGDGTYTGPGVTVTVASQPGVSLNVQVVGLGPSDTLTENGAQVSISYDVVINGGQVGDIVPLGVTGSLTTSSLGGNGGDVTNAQASLGLSFGSGLFGTSVNVGCGNVLRGADCSDPTWSGTLTANAVIGYTNLIQLSAFGVVESAGYANAFADPYVFIDPTFLAANPGLSLSLSVGNMATTATPEPSSFLLATCALLVVAGVRRTGLGAKLVRAKSLQSVR